MPPGPALLTGQRKDFSRVTRWVTHPPRGLIPAIWITAHWFVSLIKTNAHYGKYQRSGQAHVEKLFLAFLFFCLILSNVLSVGSASLQAGQTYKRCQQFTNYGAVNSWDVKWGGTCEPKQKNNMWLLTYCWEARHPIRNEENHQREKHTLGRDW